MLVLEVVDGITSDAVVSGMIARAAATRRGVLGTWVEPEARTLLGRFHATAAGAIARRRHTGGPVVPVGPAHVRIALALPHRSAMESDDPSALRPEQAMNRCVRGLLDACRTLGADVHYPGRDVVTASGAPIGWLSLGEEEDGAALFEAGLAVGESLGDLPTPPPEQVAGIVAEAYRTRGWAGVEAVGAGSLERHGTIDRDWSLPDGADRVGESATMLGCLRAHVGVDDHHRLAVIRLSGDVIAPVATMRAVERSLRGVPALRSEIERAVADTLAEARHWVLGIDGPRDVAAAVMQALA